MPSPLRTLPRTSAKTSPHARAARGTARPLVTSPSAATPEADAAAGAPADIDARIYQSVFDSVMAQRLTPGTKLPEAALCELFGVSRTVVRRVLQALAHDHIVELRPNRGAVVAAPSPEETRQIFEARRAVEKALVELAVANAKAADIAALRTQLADEHAAMHQYDQGAWARLACNFHLRIAALARNPILERYLSELMSRCSLIVALYEPPGNARCEHDEHSHIVDCIARGDAAGAAAAMGAHLQELERHINLAHTPPEKNLAHMLGLD